MYDFADGKTISAATEKGKTMVNRKDMQQNEDTLVTLLYDRECPFGYQCMTNDCMECVKMHMEKGKVINESNT